VCSSDLTPEEFIAPTAPTPGTPSPETMIRLRNAASAATRATPVEEPVAAQSEGYKPRSGIGSLISRMTGHGADTPAERPAATLRQQPPVSHGDTPAQLKTDSDADQDRIEIPAFLRRQAN